MHPIPGLVRPREPSFSENWIATPLSAMVAFVAFFLFSPCLVLEFWTVDVQLSSARTRNDDFDAAAGKEMMKRSREGDGVKKVDLAILSSPATSG